MTDYQKTKIYKIESHLGDKIYVGSTAKEYLSQRFQYHRSGYKLWKSGKSDKVMSYDLFDEYGLVMESTMASFFRSKIVFTLLGSPAFSKLNCLK